MEAHAEYHESRANDNQLNWTWGGGDSQAMNLLTVYSIEGLSFFITLTVWGVECHGFWLHDQFSASITHWNV